MPHEPQQENLPAETRLIEAQIAKIQWETAPQSSLQRLGSGIMEFVKVTGALVIGFGGIVAAVTGYQLYEVKKEKLLLENAQINAQITEKQKQLKEITDILTTREKDLKYQDQELKKNTEALQKTTKELVASAQGGIPNPNTKRSLEKIESLSTALDKAEATRLIKQQDFTKEIQKVQAPLR